MLSRRVAFRSAASHRSGRDSHWTFWPPAWFFHESKSPYPPDQNDAALFESETKEAFENDTEILAEEWKALRSPIEETILREPADRSLKREAREAQAAESVYKEAEGRLFIQFWPRRSALNEETRQPHARRSLTMTAVIRKQTARKCRS
jgi:hypothetical protein